MNRGHGQSKRQREEDQQRKRQDKDRRRQEKRGLGAREVPIVSGSSTPEGSPSVEEIMRSLERGGGPDRSAAALPSRLFVGGLDDQVTEADLKTAFGSFGAVVDCVVMRDRDSRAPRGFGFVTMSDRKDAPRAIAGLHGTDMKGRMLVVNVATERR